MFQAIDVASLGRHIVSAKFEIRVEKSHKTLWLAQVLLKEPISIQVRATSTLSLL